MCICVLTCTQLRLTTVFLKNKRWDEMRSSGILIHPAIWPQQIWAENWEMCPFRGAGAGSPCNTMWPGPRPTCMPSFILIHLTVWPQYTNVTERQTDCFTNSCPKRNILRPMSYPWQSHATLTCDKGRTSSRKWDRACRTLRHGASHSRATRFRNRALLYSLRLWRVSKSRVKDARQNRKCDISLRN